MDKKVNVDKNNQIKFQNTMTRKKYEFSKIFTITTFITMILHLICTIVFKVKNVDILPIFTTMIPIYLTIFGGYFGKSGFENHAKIKMNTYDSYSDNDGFEINDDGEIQ